MSEQEIQYTNINHVARKNLEITMNEYCVADSIYHISNDPKFKWLVNRTYLWDFLWLSRQSVLSIIKRLISLWLLDDSWNRTTEKRYNSTVKKVNTEWQETWQQSDKKVYTNCKETLHNNNNINNNKNKISNNTKSSFEKFWKLYPVKKSKQKVFDKFQKALKETTIEKLIEWVENYVKEHEQKVKRWDFTPEYKYPTTRFNNKCREDEYDVKDEKEMRPMVDQQRKAEEFRKEQQRRALAREKVNLNITMEDVLKFN